MEKIILLLSLGSFLILLIVLFQLKQNKQKSLLEEFRQELEKNWQRLENVLKDEMFRTRDQVGLDSQRLREEINNIFKLSSDSLIKQLMELTRVNEEKLEKMRQVMAEELRLLKEDNNQKLEKMRQTVDDKLQSTLEKRLSESFKLVSERLDLVHRGLGEMQDLAAGVGDLKKVLVNVKTRGNWGEIQLGNLLEQILAPGQYEKNVITKVGSNERVEFAIKLPGRDEKTVWLPVDAKFPKEDYERLLEAQDKADTELVASIGKDLEKTIRQEAKKIKEKYIDPPNTIDFGVLFLPVEGLYAEVLRRSGLCEFLQREFRVVVAGPTTIAALLNSLQMGFRTLAIEKRASQVWQLLGMVKTDFIRFGDILDKTHDKLRQASDTIEVAVKKSRSIQRKLKGVEDFSADNKDISYQDYLESDSEPEKSS